MQGLKTYKALEKKAAYEAEFTRRINDKPDFKYKYGNLLPRLRQLYADAEPYFLARDNYTENILRGNEVFDRASTINGIIALFDRNGETFALQEQRKISESLTGAFKNYNSEVDEALVAAQLEMFAAAAKPEWGGDYVRTEAARYGGFSQMAAWLFKNSVIPDKDKLAALLGERPPKVVETLKNDPVWQLWSKLNAIYTENVLPKTQELQPQINLLQRQYMAAQMEVFREKRFFPDANSTLRMVSHPAMQCAMSTRPTSMASWKSISPATMNLMCLRS
jgi:hypothetical protein